MRLSRVCLSTKYQRSVPRTASLGGVWDVGDYSQTIGVVGLGYLSSSVIQGLCTAQSKPMRRVLVSPRGKKYANSLKQRFPDLVDIAADNSQVARESDVIFLGVRPEHVESVLAEIKGRIKTDASLVSFISSKKRKEIAEMAGIDRDLVCKVIPVPTSAIHRGTTILYPDSLFIANIFSVVGSVHPCRTAAAMNALLTSACLMGNFFRTLKESRDWCVKEGTDPVVASEYLASLYNGIIGADVKRVCSDPKGYESLIEEQTPGGFNRRLIEMMEERGIYKAFSESLDRLRADLDK